MKKYIAVLMTIILFFQAVPFSSLAENRLTEAELAAARALAGIGTEAAGFHSVNASSVENMDARELKEHLDEILDTRIHSLENYYEDIENELKRLETEQPASYSLLTSGRFAGMPEEVHMRFRETEGVRMKLEYWTSRLDTQAGVITSNIELLDDPYASDYEKRLSVHRIRQASAEIRDIRSEVSDQLESTTEQLESRLQEMANPGYSSGRFASGTSVGGWAAELLNASESEVQATSFSSASLFPSKQTLLARLSPVSAAQAEDTDATLEVLSDKQNMIEVKDAQNNPIKDAEVIITDLRAETEPKTVTGQTKTNGRFTFENAGFIMEDDCILFSLEVRAEGYNIAVIDEAELKKGSAFHISLRDLASIQNKALPYVAGCSFDGHDCLYSEYNALYSPQNDYVSPVTVTVINPSDSDCAVQLMYQDIDQKQYYHTMGAVGSDGKEDTSLTTVPAGGRVKLVTWKDWRRHLKPGGNKFELIVDGKNKTDDKNTVLQIAVYYPWAVVTGTATGSPSFVTTQYSITPTLLTVEKAKLEKPIVEASMTTKFFSQGLNFFNFSFPIESKLGPWFDGGSVGLDLPIPKIIPRISVAIDGSTSVVVGVDPGDFTGKKGPLVNWKNKDSQVIDRCLKESDKSNSFKKKLKNGYYTGLWSAMKGGLKMGTVRGTVGVFAGLVFRIEHGQSGSGTWTSKNLTGLIGIVPSLTIDLIYYNAPFYIGFTVDASLTIAAMLGGTIAINDETDLTNEGITDLGLNPRFEGMSILLNITGTLYAGAGVKGFLGISLNGFGYVNMLFELKGDRFTHLKIWAAGGAYVLVELLFAHYKQNIYTSPEWVIYEGDWAGKKASLNRVFSRLFISAAEAEEDMPPTEKAKSLKAVDYPDLVAESEKVVGPIEHKGSAMKLMEIEGVMYAFYLTAEAGENKKTRVTWTNLGTGQSGTFESALKRASEKQSLFFNNTEREMNTDSTPPEIVDELFRDSNAVLYGQDDVAFDVAAMEIEDDAKVIYSSMYVLSVVNADVAESEDEIVLNGTPSLYMLAFTQGTGGSLTCDIPLAYRFGDAGWTLLRYPRIGYNMLYSRPAAGDDATLKDLVTRGVTTCAAMTMQDASHDNTLATVNITAGNNLATFVCYMPFANDDDKTVSLVGTYRCRPDVTMHAGELQVGVTPAVYAGETYYSLEEDAAGKNTLTYMGPYKSEIEKDAEIPYYRILGSTNVDYLFYITTEQTEEKTLHHLKAANLEHWPKVRRLPTYVFTDPDITIPGGRFNVQEIAGTIYVYWLESTVDEDDRSKLIYRLRGVAYDPNSGVASDDFVLAQFYSPENETMGDLLLTPQGSGYYVMDSNIYSFPFQLKAALDLDNITLSEDVVGQGENDLVNIRLVNNGNLAISAFTITETAVELVEDENGVLQPNGNEELIETITCNTLDSDFNRVHLEGDPEDLDITGREAIWREPLVLDNVTQDYWEVKQVTRRFSDHTTYSDSNTEVDLDAMEILPGQVAAYSLVIKVPSGWVGKTHRLKLALQDYSASGNQVRSMARQAGLLDKDYSLQADETLTYHRSTDGSMVLNGGGLRLNAGNSLFVGEVDAPLDAVLDHQLDNLVVTGRVYMHANGERRLTLYITNDTVDLDSIRLYCEVRYDNDDNPVYMDLPYDPGSMSHARTHTIDIPVSAIANGRNAHKAEITIRGIGIEETTLLDNIFEVNLDDGDPLRIVVQPQSVTAREGETVRMSVKAAGGIMPYVYQWQEYMGESLGWRNIKDATSDTLTLEKVTMGMNGRRYRCVVTDQNLDSVVSDEAALTVQKRLLPTGDASQPLWFTLAFVILLIGWFVVRRRQDRLS